MNIFIKKMLVHVITILFLALITIGCDKAEIDQKTETLVFPIGRSSFESNSYIVRIISDSVYTYAPKVITDSNNGYWLEFSRKDLEEFQTVQIQFNREKQDLVIFNETSNDFSRWLSPSYYIDSDNDKIKEKAFELTKNLTSNFTKAKQIHGFVISNINFDMYLTHSAYHKASTTFDKKIGTCMNFSRLFVALCRAANIPARTIWGVMYGYDGNSADYNFHHQWAEILDDNNNWRVLDLTFKKYFDLNDIRYLDLIYAPEENDMVRDRYLKEIMLGPLKYQNGYPSVSDVTNFSLISDNQPFSLTTAYLYKYNIFIDK